MKTSSTFSSILMDLRLESGLSQQQLADRAGISRQMVNYLIEGKQGPSLKTAQKLAKALGVSLAVFDGCQV